MGSARIQNDLDAAANSSGGFARFRDHPTIIKKGMEFGDPSDAVHAAVYWTGIAAVIRAALPPLKDAVIAWLKGRADREIELTVGKHTVRIKGENDADKAFSTLEKLIELGAGRDEEE